MESSCGRHDREWLDFVSDLVARPLVCWPDEQVTRLLIETFGATAGVFFVQAGDSPLEMRQWPCELFAGRRSELYRWTLQKAPTEHPLLRYYLGTGDIGAMQVDDVPAPFAGPRVRSQYRELVRYFMSDDVQAQMSLPLIMSPHANRAFLIGRPHPLTPDEMRLSGRLQRLLAGLDRQITALSQWSSRGGPEAADAAQAVHLTPREIAVLDLVAAGLTASAIGRRLHIAEGTVHKHLQHCYTKLGVADRLTAVQRAQCMGMLVRP